MSPLADLYQRQNVALGALWAANSEKGGIMMNGYDMNNGGIWMAVMVVIAVLVIAALVKYLRK